MSNIGACQSPASIRHAGLWRALPPHLEAVKPGSIRECGAPCGSKPLSRCRLVHGRFCLVLHPVPVQPDDRCSISVSCLFSRMTWVFPTCWLQSTLETLKGKAPPRHTREAHLPCSHTFRAAGCNSQHHCSPHDTLCCLVHMPVYTCSAGHLYVAATLQPSLPCCSTKLESSTVHTSRFTACCRWKALHQEPKVPKHFSSAYGTESPSVTFASADLLLAGPW